MNTSTHKTRIVCGAIALNLLTATSGLLAQTVPLAETQPAPEMVPPRTAPAPVVDAPVPAPTPMSATQPLATETAAGPVSGNDPKPAAEVVVAPARPAMTAAPLHVVYSRQGLDNSMTNEAMNGLRVVRQQAARSNVGQQVVINAALILLTGGLALNVRSFSKDDLTGIEPEDAIDRERLKNPAIQRLPAEVQQRSAQWLLQNEKAREMKFHRPLVINSAAWRLIYNSLDEADLTYKLKFDVEIYKDRESPSFITGNKRAGYSCSYVSEARTMSDWKANDYQAVVDAAPHAVRQCTDQIVAQLPHLLELE